MGIYRNTDYLCFTLRGQIHSDSKIKNEITSQITEFHLFG